jgi:large subunit ribosomal protein L31
MEIPMKKDIHPPYQDILFVDNSTGYKFVCGSALQPKGKETFEGKEYPVCHVTVSSSSHPFFTGSKQFVDAEGRVDKFLKRYAQKGQQQKEQQQKKQEEESSDLSQQKKTLLKKKKK